MSGGTGASPRRADIPGAEHAHDSEHFLRLPELPERIVFIGGGYISFEFAHVAARAGAKEVTILHRSERVLKNFVARYGCNGSIVRIGWRAGDVDGGIARRLGLAAVGSG